MASKTTKNRSVALLGAGTMGRILLGAIKNSGEKCQIIVCDRNKKKLLKIKESFPKVAVTGNPIDLGEASVLFLAIKPQDFRDIRIKAKKSAVVISVMAGVPLLTIMRELGTKKIIRAMPNTPSLLGKGFVGWTATKEITSAERGFAKKVFNVMGENLYVRSEDQINKITAISASGPAYFFYTILCFIKAAQALGFTENEAERAVLKTAEGAIALLKQNRNVEELIRSVASKGGTTEVALAQFEHGKLTQIWLSAVRAAYKKAKQLAKRKL